MASGTTPVKTWPYPLETDTPDVAADLHALALALEVVGKTTQGTLASRPSSGMTAGDRHIVEGDATGANNGTEWYYTGSAWVVLSGGSWTPITLGTGVIASPGLYAPAVRVRGDVVQLSGGFKNNTGGSITAFGTVPAGFRPASVILCAVAASGGLCVPMQIDSSGNLTTTIGVAAASSIVVDGILYRLT